MTTNLPDDRKSPWGGVKARTAPSTEVAEFLDELKAKTPSTARTGRGRLIFALDATASRQPTWDQACMIQGSMFQETARLGGLDLQLVFYRGFNETKASGWVTSAADLHRLMRLVSCVGGETQIERVLSHALKETAKRQVNALVFVGDAMEEKADRLCHLAGELGALGVPVFVFHEGNDPIAAAAFKQIASLSRGHYLAFDLANVARLKDLLGAIAVFSTGNREALSNYGKQKGGEVLRLTSQLHLPRPGSGSGAGS